MITAKCPAGIIHTPGFTIAVTIAGPHAATDRTWPFASGVTRPGAAKISSHILNNLKPDERVAIFTRDSEVHFQVHPATDTSEAVRVFEDRKGSPVPITHLRDLAGIRAFVAAGERDIGGEG